MINKIAIINTATLVMSAACSFVTYVIALPLIYWGSDQWLSNFTCRISLESQLFILPPVVLMFITLTTIDITSLRAALESPVKSIAAGLGICVQSFQKNMR